MGDGVAVIPHDGKIVSPVDGEVVSVADTLHAYGFRSENGLELLVHIGLETVSLHGACFKSHVKVGDKVKKGDLVAEVDLEFLEKNHINPITPVLVCDGMEGKSLNCSEGKMEAGKTVILTVLDDCAPEKVRKKSRRKKKRRRRKKRKKLL
ncbi:MAG: PTS glucose transporter subunit IIA [Hominisplanchenecus sp.]